MSQSQKEMFRIPFQAKKHPKSMFSFGRVLKKVRCICLISTAYHTPWNKQFIPMPPKPSPLRWLQAFEWRLQTCDLGFFSKFAEHISDSWIYWSPKGSLFRDFLPNLSDSLLDWLNIFIVLKRKPSNLEGFVSKILLTDHLKKRHTNQWILWSREAAANTPEEFFVPCVWRQVLLEVVPLSSFTHP